jgi:hypothetical protein
MGPLGVLFFFWYLMEEQRKAYCRLFFHPDTDSMGCTIMKQPCGCQYLPFADYSDHPPIVTHLIQTQGTKISTLILCKACHENDVRCSKSEISTHDHRKYSIVYI